MSKGKRNREARRAERTARRNHLVPRFYLARFGDHVEPFNAEVRPLAPEDRVAAVAASLESVWP